MHSGLTDLDMLIDFEKDARLAAVAYLSTAAEAHDPELKDVFIDFSRGSLKMQSRCTEMIKKIGGEI